MAIIRTVDRSDASLTNSFGLRSTGVIRPWGSAPAYKASGANTAGVGTATVSWPSGTCKGDLGILVVESSGGDAAASLSGWSHFAGSPVVDVADATGSKLSVLWRFADSDSPANQTLPDPGDHQIVRLLTFTGVSRTRPSRITATDTKTTASTSVTWPSLVTPSPNCLVLYVASRPDDSSLTTVFSSFANSSLTSVTEIGESGSTQGDGGGIVMGYGIKAVQSSVGNATATMSVSVTNALFVAALEPDMSLPA